MFKSRTTSCSRCTARPVADKDIQAQTKSELYKQKKDLIQRKNKHKQQLHTLTKQGKANTQVAAFHESKIEELKQDIDAIEDRLESLA